jgi:Ca2+-binding RTX toxin-like protein
MRRAILLAMLAVPLLGGTAHADPSCVYEPFGHEVLLTGDPSFPRIVVSTTPTGAITASAGSLPIVCAGASVADTDSIVASGLGGSITFDATNGAFAPGLTPEATGDSEIELAANGFSTVTYEPPLDQPATLSAGADGLSVNGDDDVDLTYGDATTLAVQLSQQDDTVVATGGHGSGGALPASIEFDALPAPQPNGDTWTGSDVLTGHAGIDHLEDITSAAATIRGLGGNDVLNGGDMQGGVYEVDGGSGNDILVAQDGATTLNGGSGNDVFTLVTSTTAHGQGGDDTFYAENGSVDTITGGSGADTAYAEAFDHVRGVESVR